MTLAADVEKVFELANVHGAIFVWNTEDPENGGMRSIDYDRLAPHLTPSGRTNVQGLIARGALRKIRGIERTFLVPGWNGLS